MSSRGARKGGSKQKPERKHKPLVKGRNKPQGTQPKKSQNSKKQDEYRQEIYSDEEDIDTGINAMNKKKRIGHFDDDATKSYEYNIGEDFIDEEIDDDEAFGSEDELLFGEFFAGKKRVSAGNDDDDDDDDDDDEEASYDESAEESVGEDVVFTDSDAEVVDLDSLLDETPVNSIGKNKALITSKKSQPISAPTTDVDEEEEEDIEDFDDDDAANYTDDEAEESEEYEVDEEEEEVPDMHLMYNGDEEEEGEDDVKSLKHGSKKDKKMKDDLLTLLSALDEDEKKVTSTYKRDKALATKQVRRGELFAYEDQRGGSTAENEHTLNQMIQSNNGDDDDDEDGMSLFSNAFNSSSRISINDLMSSVEKSQNKSTKGDDDEANDSGDDISVPSANPLHVSAVTKKLSKLQNDGVAKTLTAPMASIKRDALQREVVHEETVAVVSKWDDVVKKNRNMPQLKFPMNVETKKMSTSASLQAQFNAANALEHDLDSLMKEYGFSEQSIREKEEMILKANAVTQEEIEEKNSKLRRMRMLMSYEEEKNKRINTIKSKSQRKFMRKQREKNQLSLEELEDIDPEMAEKERMKIEMDRIKERASLAHKNTSKWARQQLKRGKNADVQTKAAIEDQIRMNRELSRKMGKAGELEDEDDIQTKKYDQFGNVIEYQSDDDSDEEQSKMKSELAGLQKEYGLDGDDNREMEGKSGRKGLFSLAFMQRADNARKEANKQLLEDMAEEDYMSDDEEGKSKAEKRTKDNEISVKKGRKEFGPNINATDAYAVPDISSTSTVKKNNAGFGGGLFDIDQEIEGSEVYEATEQSENVIQANKFVSALAELKKKEQEAKIANVGSNPAQPSFDENTTTTTKSSTKSVAPTKSQPRQGLSADPVELAALASDSEDEENPWAQKSTGSSTKADVTKRATVAARKNFQMSNEQADMNQNKGEDHLTHENADEVILDLSMPILAQNKKKAKTDVQDERFDGHGESIDIMEQDEQAKLVEMAFAAGGNEDEEFERRKMQEIGETLPEEDPFAAGIPGWGNWGGALVKKSKKQLREEKLKRNQHKADIEAQRQTILGSRTDRDLKHVLINQDQDVKALKYQIVHVPTNFPSRSAYERSMRTPLGPDWNTQEGHRKINAPTVITREGQIITAIKWTKSMGKKTEAFEGGKAKKPQEQPVQTKRKAEEQNISISNGGKKKAKK